MKKKIDFKPLLKSPYYQTVIANYFDFAKEPPSTTHYVRLDDGDVLPLEVSTPKNWTPEKGSVALLHGLCGSSKSTYVKRVATRAYNKGRQTIRLNMRGCGIGKSLAQNIYHAGSSSDMEKALLDIKKHFPKTKIVLVGFSLGAHQTVKLAGELGKKDSNLLVGAYAVSPPINLLTSAHRFSLPKNRVYSEYFSKKLYDHIDSLHKLFPDLPPHNISPNTSINDIDELYIAKRANFSSAIDYYKECSSKKLVQDIKIPMKILLAEDDPIIAPDEFDDLQLPDNVDVLKTVYGGHIGFIGKNIFKDFRWMDNLIEEWIENIFNN